MVTVNVQPTTQASVRTQRFGGAPESESRWAVTRIYTGPPDTGAGLFINGETLFLYRELVAQLQDVIAWIEADARE